MDKILITGATGLVGFNTAKQLLAAGRPVRAAVRSVSRAREILPAEVEVVEADVCDRAAITKAIEELGWTKTPTAEAIAETMRSLR
jgi:uncharacterized protein YbjT (DUF2867 family)